VNARAGGSVTAHSPDSGRELERRRVTQAAKSPMVMMASHQAFKTHTDPPVNPVKHPLSCTHQPHPLPRLSPGRVARD